MTSDMSWADKLRPEVAERWDELRQLRREFHKMPELSFQEFKTAARIKEWLASQGIQEVESVTDTGVVALIKGGQPGRTIMYRADIDGLPIDESNDLEYASQNPGVMHACGHDAHAAVALMLTSMLHQRRQALKGNVKVVFQPAEEIGAGADPMIDLGVMESPHVDAVLGLHVIANAPVGTLGVAGGPIMAGSGTFKIKIIGQGGHAAFPHLGVDPILISAQVVTALHSIVSRNVDPHEAAVVTIGSINGGTKSNVIPDTVEMEGTIRAFSTELWEDMGQRVESIASGIATSMGGSAEVTLQIGTKPVINDEEFAERVRRHGVALVGEDQVSSSSISAGDDMASFLENAPGCYYFLGSADAEKGPQGHHQPRFVIDDTSLALGLELSLRVIDEYLVE